MGDVVGLLEDGAPVNMLDIYCGTYHFRGKIPRQGRVRRNSTVISSEGPEVEGVIASLFL